jgi:D-alanyl-D-alanine carboxypeptidase/D-alanyl-D-alanine-endopeptidase (penicillin-binding protein 4)
MPGFLPCLPFALALVAQAALPTSPVESRPEAVPALEFRPLVDLLREAVADPALAGALVGVRVDSLTTGRTLFAHNPELLLNPASVTKMFTTAAGLCLLHPDYRWRTELYSLERPERGVIKGPLYVKGNGDPFLVDERLNFLASELRAMGVKSIEGPIVLDDTAFDEESEGPGWSQDKSSKPYQAPMGALSLNFNSVGVLIFPAEQPDHEAVLAFSPDSDHFKLTNKVRTVESGRTWVRLDVAPLGNQTRLLARGQVRLDEPGQRAFARVTSPTWYLGRSLREALKRFGIQVKPLIRRGQVPRQADLLYTLASPSLGEISRLINKRSQNFMAEQLWKTLGAEFMGPPATWAKGQQVMNAFLEEEVGIPQGSYVLHNGSGLNDVNRVTASQVVLLLNAMWRRFDVRPEFLASLAVGGADGTAWGRFREPEVTRSLRVKTGSLERVRALAGYSQGRGGELFSFVILVARYETSSPSVLAVMDRMAAALSLANADRQVVREIQVLPVIPLDDRPLVVGPGPPEGIEESLAPPGEPAPPEPEPEASLH